MKHRQYDTGRTTPAVRRHISTCPIMARRQVGCPLLRERECLDGYPLSLSFILKKQEDVEKLKNLLDCGMPFACIISE